MIGDSASRSSMLHRLLAQLHGVPLLPPLLLLPSPQAESLQVTKLALDAQLAKAQADATAAQQRTAELDASATASARELAEVQSGRAAAEARVRELSDRVRTLEAAATRREEEVSELRDVQVRRARTEWSHAPQPPFRVPVSIAGGAADDDPGPEEVH